MTIKTVLVYGPTGKQGGSVVRALSAAGGFSIRAAVRDLNADKAKALTTLPGVELVLIDLSDVSTLTKATKGVDAVFAFTTINPDEVQQGVNMAEASKAAGVKLHIWSSLESISKATNGELEAAGFDNKAKVAEHLAAIGLPHVNLILGCFFENFVYFPYQSIYNGETGEITLQNACMRKDLAVGFLYTTKDVGNAVHTILQHPSDFTNTTVALGDNILSTNDLAAIVQKITGKKTTAVEDTDFGKAWGMASLSKFWNDPKRDLFANFEVPNKTLQKHGFKAATPEEWVKEQLLPFLKL